MAPPRKPRSSAAALKLVRRRCPVCEWEAVLIEPPGTHTACPECRAPTVRTLILDEIGTLEQRSAKNPHAAALGRLGGRKGGLERARRLTADERQTIARKAARARWGKKSKKR